MNSSLMEKIEKYQAELAGKMPPEVGQAIKRSIQELAQSGVATGLKVGEKGPDFKLKDALGKDVELYEALNKGPVVLTFYRGDWCPYCNLQLKAYQEILPQIKELGGQLMAINPQNPGKSLSMKENAGLEYTVLSDPGGAVSLQYNLRFDFPNYMRTLYTNMGLDLSKHNAEGEWSLPVPATMVIDRQAIVRYIFLDPDYSKRMEPQAVLDVLKSIS